MSRCPKCECNAWTVLQAAERLERRYEQPDGEPVEHLTRRERRRCEFCRHTWSVVIDDGQERDPGAVELVRLRCPVCRDGRTRVTSTRAKCRYHKCGACGHNFKSYER